jgi:hypothetical protein
MSNAQKKAAKLAMMTNTIDQKHNEIMTYFEHLEKEEIPRLEREKSAYKRKLKQSAVRIELRNEIENKLQDIRHKIQQLKKERADYVLDNSRFVFQYFEDKKKLAGFPVVSSASNNNESSSSSSKAINSFFRIKTVPLLAQELSQQSLDTKDTNDQVNKYEESRILYQKYWRNINSSSSSTNSSTKTTTPNVNPGNDDYLMMSSTQQCSFCGTGELVAQEEEGILICNNIQCGNFVPHIIDQSKTNNPNKDVPNEVSYTAYIRLNHFKEILSQFTAQQSTKNLGKVIDTIKGRLQKERITDMSTINYERMREILRNLGLNKYFEHIQYINSVFGIKPPVMSEELYETLCVLFIEIQRPWALHCPPERNNFFNYTYTLYQLCVLLDQTQYLPFIPMMKDREKQLEQDMIWKKVCEDRDWEFIATV